MTCGSTDRDNFKDVCSIYKPGLFGSVPGHNSFDSWFSWESFSLFMSLIAAARTSALIEGKPTFPELELLGGERSQGASDQTNRSPPGVAFVLSVPGRSEPRLLLQRALISLLNYCLLPVFSWLKISMLKQKCVCLCVCTCLCTCVYGDTLFVHMWRPYVDSRISYSTDSPLCSMRLGLPRFGRLAGSYAPLSTAVLGLQACVVTSDILPLNEGLTLTSHAYTH